MKADKVHTTVLLLFLVWLVPKAGTAQKYFVARGIDTLFSADTAGWGKPEFTVYLLGDIKFSEPGKQNLRLFKRFIDRENSNSAVIIPGDIAYPLGLPDSTERGHDEAVQELNYRLQVFNDFKGSVFFLPGNHDWARGKKQGWESVKNEERYIESHFNGKNVFLPDGGCPGPVEVELTPGITLIVFDSQWWLQQNKKPADEDCGFRNENEIFIRIEDALRRNRNKTVIFAAHHPLFSVGPHGGHFPAESFLFPLTEWKNWMYIPLPGFIYTGYRKFMGNIQDLAHPEYKSLRETLLNIFSGYPDLIYVAGHEHNLQYLEIDSLHHIVSGAGGKPSYIARKGKKADFACQCTGFSRLLFYRGGEVVVEFISTQWKKNGGVVFRKILFKKNIRPESDWTETLLQPADGDSSVTINITDQYMVGRFRRFMLGDNYRDIWNIPVAFSVFDLAQQQGGLSVVKRGGGMQTRSVRLENANGRQYVLRSVNKYVEKALPESFRHTVAVKIVQDGISASNPYAALTVPPLADAIGVMHTNPRLFWVPDDPRFGVYRDELANDIFLFEERPSGNWQDQASFGYSEKIVSTGKVLKKTKEDHHHRVDQQAVVKARLLDMLINDWDRHEDQWRWASFKEDGQTVYRPIPRDRDQVYFVNEGPMMWLVSRKWLMPKFQGFDYSIHNVEGLGFNARWFDRTFLNATDLDDWTQAAEELKEKITDSVIRQAVIRFPRPVYDSIGAVTEAKLKSRRDRLTDYARQYYRFLARSVDITGTNDRDLFRVNRKPNGNTEVSVYALSNKKGKVKNKLYHREFVFGETKEIRLYGLKDEDVFYIGGSGEKGIRVRVIGGSGNDLVIDSSEVKGPGKKTIIYDRKDKDNVIVKGKETRLQLSKHKSVNTYDRKQFKYNKTIPLLWAGYNIDDGMLIGGGVKIKRYQFRDSTIQKIWGNLSFQTGAFAVRYQGLFSGLTKFFDLYLDADFSFPRNVDNYFGIGNNSEKFTENKTYYRVRYKYARVNPMLKHTLNSQLYYGLGAFYQYFMVTDTADRYIGDAYPLFLDSAAYQAHHYTGVNLAVDFDSRDNERIPKKGVRWSTEVWAYYSIKNENRHFVKIRSDLSFYLSFRKDPRVVFAFRAGGAVNLGDYEFYYANFLGGKTNLRGFRSNRFAGDYTFYQNTEMRLKIMNMDSYIVNGQLGILLFNDIGRVWVKDENSKTWHDGYGIGLWFTPFDLSVLTLNYNRSKEDDLISFTFSYLF